MLYLRKIILLNIYILSRLVTLNSVLFLTVFVSIPSPSGAGDGEDIHVDIDSYDDAENQSLRETLQWEASSNSSPADSNSTNNSKI